MLVCANWNHNGHRNTVPQNMHGKNDHILLASSNDNDRYAQNERTTNAVPCNMIEIFMFIVDISVSYKCVNPLLIIPFKHVVSHTHTNTHTERHTCMLIAPTEVLMYTDSGCRLHIDRFHRPRS